MFHVFGVTFVARENNPDYDRRCKRNRVVADISPSLEMFIWMIHFEMWVKNDSIKEEDSEGLTPAVKLWWLNC